MRAVTANPMAQLEACRSAMRAAMAACPDAPAVLNPIVLAQDGWFVHRMRGRKGKDGNPLNEVRLICLGITRNGGSFPSGATIRWHPETSITGLRPGDPIRLTAPVFAVLTEAFLTEIAARFAPVAGRAFPTGRAPPSRLV